MTLHLYEFSNKDPIHLGPAGESGPRAVHLEYLTVGTLSIQGKLPFESEPHVEMEGLHFDELDVRHLVSDNLKAGYIRGHTRPCELRRRGYYWSWPSPAITLSALLCAGWLFFVPAVLARYAFARHSDAFLERVGYLLFDWPLLIWVPYVAFLALILVWVIFRRSDNIEAHQNGVMMEWVWYPQRETLFLRQMTQMDASLYGRVELWLRDRGRMMEADAVYFERRLMELKSGLTAWL